MRGEAGADSTSWLRVPAFGLVAGRRLWIVCLSCGEAAKPFCSPPNRDGAAISRTSGFRGLKTSTVCPRVRRGGDPRPVWLSSAIAARALRVLEAELKAAWVCSSAPFAGPTRVETYRKNCLALYTLDSSSVLSFLLSDTPVSLSYTRSQSFGLGHVFFRVLPVRFALEFWTHGLL